MLVFPNCKINLGLHITSKRPDGFHSIESVFLPVGWTDMLEIVPAKENQFIMDGLNIACPLEENLCYKAYQLLKSDFDLPPISMYLYKKIPNGAGLGGGSADAAFTLKMLNTMFSLGLAIENLKRYAEKLGSDCAFFITNSPSLVSGRGEILEPYSLNLQGYEIVIIKAPISVSTAEAYKMVTPKAAEYAIAEILKQDISAWRDSLKNDFEEPIFEKYPELAQMKNLLYAKGALYAAMSGSGSAIYGIFRERIDFGQTFKDCLVWQGAIKFT